jgi:hypothetical protein
MKVSSSIVFTSLAVIGSTTTTLGAPTPNPNSENFQVPPPQENDHNKNEITSPIIDNLNVSGMKSPRLGGSETFLFAGGRSDGKGGKRRLRKFRKRSSKVKRDGESLMFRIVHI